jgi:hypothetical protein
MAEEAIGKLIERLASVKKKKLDYNHKIDELSKAQTQLEQSLIATLKLKGLDGAKSSKHSVSIKEQTYPSIENWDDFTEYVRKNKRFELLERRVSASAYREYLQLGRKVSGVVPFTKVAVSLTTLKGK